MKSYTDLEQSKKLAKLLPIESADMTWEKVARSLTENFTWKPTVGLDRAIKDNLFSYKNGYVLPCWSLTALLAVIKPVNENTYTIRGTLDGGAAISFEEVTTVMFQEEEIIDAVFEMVVYLKENKLI